MSAPGKVREHGTRAKYVVERCRCDECRRACREYERWRSRQQAYGRTPYVDATGIRAHVRALSINGLGWKRVADLAGVPRSTVWKLLYGDPARNQEPTKRVRRRTAAALLAVTAEPSGLAGGARVPAVGTQRRLQALVAIGWSQSRLAVRMGMLPTNFTRTIDQTAQVTAATARRAAELYAELWDNPPSERTGAERRSAARARNHAAARGWTVPMGWDDESIDDPDALPADTGRDAEIARRLGVDVAYVDRIRRRANDREAAS